ncbi:MAG: zinc finger-like domain-containing protein [Acidimicrobiaceae bacterium]|nr:zinc finger-like domain-containing protein [Acidimicrobiaceae bacterium]
MSATTAFTDDELADLVAVAGQPGYGRWREMVRSTGGCADPIHLTGESALIDRAAGEVLHSYRTADEPNRQLLVACRNRRASRCPSCAETYRADTYHLIRAGLAGGKSVPETVAGHPRVFATFTAPSFGPVHHRVLNDDGSVKRCHPEAGCKRRHDENDPLLGQAIDLDWYDYEGAVIWNALAGKLWHRTTTLIVRQLAQYLGLTEGQFRKQCRVSFGKVAEFQARGLVHFHAIFRLDGPDGPASAPPDSLTTGVLMEAVRHAGARALVASPGTPATGGPRHIVWGEQLDVRPITAAGADDEEITDQKVAGYVAKYATKAAENTGTLDRPVVCWRCKGTGHDPDNQWACGHCHGRGTRYNDVHHLGISPHAQAMISACWTLGGRPELEDLRLRAWAHMLGFGGHFSTRSRRYSTTLGCLRQARQDWRMRRIERAFVPDEPDEGEETVLVIGQWQYHGRGYSPGEAIYARTIANDLAESRRIARQMRAHEEEEP